MKRERGESRIGMQSIEVLQFQSLVFAHTHGSEENEEESESESGGAEKREVIILMCGCVFSVSLLVFFHSLIDQADQ